MANFWNQLFKPFFILAPMDEVTDTVFRQMVASIAAPNVFFTEFTNVEGLFSNGREALMPRLKYNPKERPIVAQLWGINPDNFCKAAKLVKQLGFDGVDINMGCPERSIVKQGSCSALINNPKLAKEIILATIKGATGLPVSIKTRIGFDKVQTEEWVGFLLQFNLASITIHARTSKQMSKVAADWDEIKKAVQLRDKLKSKTLIIGNGDVTDRVDGLGKVKETGVDGIMIGRGIFQNIWAFDKHPYQNADNEKMLQILLQHVDLFEKTWGNAKNFVILRKFFKIYISGFANSHKLRIALMKSSDPGQVKVIVSNYLRQMGSSGSTKL